MVAGTCATRNRSRSDQLHDLNTCANLGANLPNEKNKSMRDAELSATASLMAAHDNSLLLCSNNFRNKFGCVRNESDCL